MDKLAAQIQQLSRAMDRLEEALREPVGALVRDAAIQRFEFTFDLAWKTLKVFLEERHGVACASPKTCIREAFRVGVIHNERWIDLVELRNLTAHTYNETTAVQVYGELPAALEKFHQLMEVLQQPG
jgi:nucleotidyltransferase substrate binding protein (TIGR01987 family)